MASGEWRRCGREDRDGRPCPGIQADNVVKPVRYTQRLSLCLAHLGPRQLDEVLARLHPGCEIDVRGTRVGGDLLRRVLDAVVADGNRTLRDANFTDARFDGNADFGNTVFLGKTRFRGASFSGTADFDQVRFDGDAADFGQARFQRASFRWTRFDGTADFSGAEFLSRASFTGARFGGHLDLRGAQFFSQAVSPERADFTGVELESSVDLDGVWCHHLGGLDLSGATFAAADRLGPLGAEFLLLDRARFESSVSIEALAAEVSCNQARFDAGVNLRLRYARLRLESVVLSAASSLKGSEPGKDAALDPLADPARLAFDNSRIANLIRDSATRPDIWMPVLSSVQGVDVTELGIADVDLSQTRFSGAHHLDRLSIEGQSRFAEPLRRRRWGSVRVRWAWPPLWWWTRRQLLAEEATWRATQRRGADWSALAEGTGPATTAQALAAMYRSLRKAQEDNKNGPGASDFYYGEMEMRRHAPSTSSGERVVLFLYWITSGYGLRALRALGCLLAVVVLVSLAMHGTGFVNDGVGIGPSTLYVAEAAFSLQAQLPGTDVLTWQGEVLRLLMRLIGPLLLGLMLLSVRNRVKR